jgi:hypothetical protein
VGDQTFHAVAGSFVFVPRSVPHTFSNPGPEPAHIIVIGSSPVQAMVEATGRVTLSGPPHPDAVAGIYAQFDSRLLARPQ